MRISILVSPESQTLIQRILASQSLATQASVARQAFELGLRALAGAHSPTEQHPDALRAAEKEARLARIKAEWGTDEQPEATALNPPKGCNLAGTTRNGTPIFLHEAAAAERDLAVLEQAHAAKVVGVDFGYKAATAIHPEDERLEYLTPSLSPDEDEPTLASTPSAIASQPPPTWEPLEPEQNESDELDAFLEALS